jgi:prolyl 4-hydroxylase
VEEGGETTFPAATDGQSAEGGLSSCGQRGLAVKPHLGQALLFFSMSLDGNTARCAADRPAAHTDALPQDATSLHAGCPVIKGNKWTGASGCR